MSLTSCFLLQFANQQQNQLIKEKPAEMTQKLWILFIDKFANLHNKIYT